MSEIGEATRMLLERLRPAELKILAKRFGLPETATVEDIVRHRERGEQASGVVKSTLNSLRDACHTNAKYKGFHDPEVRPSVGESIALIHSELSEALEDHRKGHTPNHVWYEEKAGKEVLKTDRFAKDAEMGMPVTLNKPCGIPSEMADVIIRVLDFCGLHDIDIDRAVRQKMAFNAQRPFRHGDKKL